MAIMIAGLLLFLGVHSVRIVADGWRTACLARLGPLAWKGIYSLIAIAGLVLIVYGYGQTRLDPVFIWHPPMATATVSLFMLPAFILLVAAYVPHPTMSQWTGHPMIIAVILWAIGHLLANGRLGDIVLFAAFLLWALLDWRAARRRPAATPLPANIVATVTTLVLGLIGYYLFAFHLHVPLIGVPVM